MQELIRDLRAWWIAEGIAAEIFAALDTLDDERHTAEERARRRVEALSGAVRLAIACKNPDAAAKLARHVAREARALMGAAHGGLA
jgi:hypothetical protein